MITADANKNSLKEIRERERQEKEKEIRDKCEAIAIERYGDVNTLINLSNKTKGIWYLPHIDDDGNVLKLLILKPIDRNILSYASTKIEDEGLYAYLEACMRECTIKEHSDMDMYDDEEIFLSAANRFNKVMEGKKTFLVKR